MWEIQWRPTTTVDEMEEEWLHFVRYYDRQEAENRLLKCVASNPWYEYRIIFNFNHAWS